MTHTQISSPRTRTVNPFSETMMKPFNFIKRTALKLATAVIVLASPGLSLPATAGPLLAQTFEKTGKQINCDYVQFELYYSHKYTIGEDPELSASWRLKLRDKLPKGLAIVNATISGDVTGPGGGLLLAPEIKTTTNPSDTLVWKGLRLSKVDKDGLGGAFVRSFRVKILAKIDKSKFPVAKLVSNQAKLTNNHGEGIMVIKSHDAALPPIVLGQAGKPTKLIIDVTDCKDDVGGGDPGFDACFKVETGEVECDREHPGDFIYKMNIGAEYGGKIIELVATTPGVSIFPASQIVPAGGGVLVWHIQGAAPGMTVHLIANGLTDGEVQHVAGPSEGLGLCCVQEIEILIPIDLDCPPEEECKEGDKDCPPPGGGCEEGDKDCPPPVCDPQWEDCPCDPNVEKCDPPETKKPDLRLEKKVIDEWCLSAGNGNALCTYQIRIWNAGGAAYNGPVTVRDRYPNGAPISSTFSPIPPWACFNTGDPAKFVCNGNVNLPPLAETFLTVQALVSFEGYPSRKVKNCAILKQQDGQPEMCATAKLPDPKTKPKTPELKITKTCDSNGPATFASASVRCRITITNTGTGAAVGPLSINDVTTNLSIGSNVIIQSVNPDAPAADWTCTPAPTVNLNCSIDGSKVGPGVSRHFDVSFNFDVQQARYKNCVEGQMQREGSVHTFDSVCVEDGIEPGSEGPTDPKHPDDISVEKTGDDRCEPGVPCTFDITIKNGGNKDFNGKVAIVDGITNTGGGIVSGASVSVSPPFGCNVEPDSLPFGCVATLHLGAGQSRTHKVSVIMPEGETGTAGSALTNCVMLGEPGILDADVDEMISIAPGNAGRDAPVGKRTSCHSFTLDEPEQCTSGMVLTDAGNCQCPAGTRWNGRRCYGKPPVIIPPVVDLDPVCPIGMDRFRSFKGRPIGYVLERVRSNGRSIICGAPRCAKGWIYYDSRSAIPRGWSKKRIGRRNSSYKFWCAKPPRKPALQCWGDAWTQIAAGQIKRYRRKGYDVKPRSRNNRTIWCARKVVRNPLQCWSTKWVKISKGQVKAYKRKGYTVKRRVETPNTIYCATPGLKPDPKLENCPSGWTKYPRGQAPKGWITLKRLYDNGRNICAKAPATRPLACWKGWTKVWLGEIRSYKHKGYNVKSRGKGKNAIWCVKPNKPQSCVPGPNEVKRKGQCVCKRGYERNRTATTGFAGCVKKVTPPALQCWKGWSKIPASRVNTHKQKGFNVKSRRKGKLTIWCAKPGSTSNSCKKPRFKNKKGICTCGRNKVWNARKNSCDRVISVSKTCSAGQKKVTSSKAYARYKRQGWTLVRKGGFWCGRPPKVVKTCTSIGKVGKWPRCRNKVVKTCAGIGKVGKWPRCRNKVAKTCASIGKIGKWPRCRNKVVKTCARIGKVGKWPNCRNKRIINVKPRPRKTCAQIGKLGKWPRCFNRKPVIKFKPVIVKPRGQVIR
jgi:hypothetical protein